jgi:hypothetical protein
MFFSDFSMAGELILLEDQHMGSRFSHSEIPN